MKKVIVRCGCGHTVKTLTIDDGKDYSTVIYVGECEYCAISGEYDKSPHWNGGETMRRKDAPKTKK